jgi:hypothetical protein
MSQDAGIDIDMDKQLAEIQAVSSGVKAEIVHEVRPDSITPVTKSVEFMGQRFRIADKIGAMPLLKFSTYADMDIQDPRALAAMYTLLRDVIYPGTPSCGDCEFCDAGNERSCKSYDRGDWTKFEDHAMTTKADADELMDVVTKVMELISGRPTGQSGTSSSGPPASSGRSTGSSSGKRGKASRR